VRLFVLRLNKSGDWMYNKTDGLIRYCAYTTREKAEAAIDGTLREHDITIVKTTKAEVVQKQKDVNRYRKGPKWERMRAAEDTVSESMTGWFRRKR